MTDSDPASTRHAGHSWMRRAPGRPPRHPTVYCKILPWRWSALVRSVLWHRGLAFAAALAALGVVGALSYRSTLGLIEIQSRLNHTREVIHRLDELMAQGSQAESAARGFILSGEPQYAEYFRAASTRIAITFRDLQELAAENARQREALSGLKSAFDEKLNGQARVIEMRRTAGNAAALEAFLAGRGYVLMNRIDGLVDRIRDEERNLLRGRTGRAQREAEQSTLGSLSAALLSFAILLAVYRQLAREVARRKHSERNLVRSSRLYTVLSEVNQALARVRDRRRIFEEFCRIAVEHGRYRLAWLGVVVTAEQIRLKREAVAGLPGDAAAWFEPLLEMSAEVEHVVCNDLGDDTCRLRWGSEARFLGFGSAAVLPIAVHGRPVAVFALCAAEAGAFDEENLALLQDVVSGVAFALENLDRNAP